MGGIRGNECLRSKTLEKCGLGQARKGVRDAMDCATKRTSVEQFEEAKRAQRKHDPGLP